MSFHPVRVALYAALAIFSIILIGLTSARIHHTKHLGQGYDPIVVELLVTSILAFLWSLWTIHAIARRFDRGVGTSYLSEYIGLFILWVMFLVGAAIATNKWHGLGFCWNTNTCRILTAIVAWSWITWVVTTALLLSALLSEKSGNYGLGGPLHGRGDGVVGGAAPAAAQPETRTVGTARDAPVSAV